MRGERENETAQTKVPPSPAFYSHVETCRETFSQVNTGFLEDLASTKLMKGQCFVLCSGVPQGSILGPLFIFFTQRVPVKISTWSILSWQDVQCGLKYQASFESVLGKTWTCKKIYHSMVLYWHMRRPQCISWPDCVEAPGCHLTICGGFRCIGKGLVNAYSFMVSPKSIFPLSLG